MAKRRLTKEGMALTGLAAMLAGTAVWGIDAQLGHTLGPFETLGDAYYHLTGPYHSVTEPIGIIFDNLRYVSGLGKLGFGMATGGLAALIYAPFRKVR